MWSMMKVTWWSVPRKVCSKRLMCDGMKMPEILDDHSWMWLLWWPLVADVVDVDVLVVVVDGEWDFDVVVIVVAVVVLVVGIVVVVGERRVVGDVVVEVVGVVVGVVLEL